MELTDFFDFRKIIVAILSTPILVNKIHQDKPWPVHLLDLMHPQELEVGDGYDPELTKVLDEENVNH